MSRRRYLSTTISTDGRVNKLALEAGDFAVLLYTWLIPHAKDDGTIHGTVEEMMFTVLPGRRDKTESDIVDALTAMQNLGLIEWDRGADIVSFPAEGFYKNQTYIKPENRRNGDDNGQQRETPQNAEESKTTVASAQIAASSSSSVSLSVPLSSSLPLTDDEAEVLGVLGPIIPQDCPKPDRQRERMIRDLRRFPNIDGLAVADRLVNHQLRLIEAQRSGQKIDGKKPRGPYVDIAGAFRDWMERDAGRGFSRKPQFIHPPGNGVIPDELPESQADPAKLARLFPSVYGKGAAS